MITICLTETELMIARLIGKLRTRTSRKNDLSAGYTGFEGDHTPVDIIGAAGEMAVAKLLGIYWSAGVNTFHGADLGINIQVRATDKIDYSLIVRQDDDDQHAYILVISQSPEYHIVGWLWGHECKKDQYWKAPNNRPGAWFVPQDKLKDMNRLEIVKHWIDAKTPMTA